MPVIRPTGRGESLASLRNRLSDLLVKELMGERTRNGPLIYEIPVEASALDVIVVWEAWRHIPPIDRNPIIRNAYSRYYSILDRAIRWGDPAEQPVPTSLPAIQMATGATWEESKAFLPYAVVPSIRDEGIDLEELHALMNEAGGIVTPEGVQLRFPDASMAAEAHAKLSGEMPEAHWSIVEDRGTDNDWSGS